MATWIVSGSPLIDGAGWKIWYSNPGHGEFRPEPVKIFRSQNEEETESQEWRLLSNLNGLDRRMGVLTVRLAQPKRGALYEIHIPEAESSEPFRWRTLPAAIMPDPELSQHGVSFLMASCFWRENDKEGTYLAAVRQLTKQWSPAFKLLVGDQVYTDWPADYSPDFTGHPEVELYADRYAEYWGDPFYRELLQTSPNFFMCDDHEFWNDYPEKQIHLTRSQGDFASNKYVPAAQNLYERFQRCANPGDRRWYQFTVCGVAIFVADTRSEREFCNANGSSHIMLEPQWRDLELWVRGLQGPGILVLGQPLLQKDGDWKDHSLSNFAADYGRLWSIIEASLSGNNDQQKPHDILVLSGDIHTGRFAVARRSGLDAPEGVPELIASPAAMIQPGSKEPEEPDYKFTVRRQGTAVAWQVDRQPFMTLNNNIGMVRLLPGTNGRVLFELSIYQIRPYDSRSWWDKLRGQPVPAGSLLQLFRKEIELR